MLSITFAMDGPAIEHSSDSDTSDSWTLLENSTDTPELPGESSSSIIENQERDEDTDGISIISDSEPDSPSPVEIIYETLAENHSPEHETAEYIPVDSQLTNMHDHESIEEEDDLLDENIRRNKTYVHRRNKRLSSLLNIVLMASIITAVGVAIGHIWGAKTDCTLQNIPGVNKILSKLYRLQEENAYLRSKLKEITVLNNHQANNKVPLKQTKCRKVFEESLQNDNTKRLTMCVDGKIDNNNRILNSHMIHNPYEKDFVQDIVNLKSIDVQNKGSINEKTPKNLKQVHKYHKNMKSPPYIYVENATKLKYTPETLKHSDNEKAADHSESRISYADSLKSSGGFKNYNNREYDITLDDHKNGFKGEKDAKQSDHMRFDKKFSKRDSDKLFETIVNKNNINPKGEFGDEMEFTSTNDGKVNENEKQSSKDYEADDDLHFDKDNEDGKKFNKNDYQKVFAIKEDIDKKFGQNDYDADTDSVFDDFLKKDNRYTGPKHKKEKKNNLKKLHKREKKRNKYEQRKMKDGLMKAYDDISLTSSQDNEFVVKEQNLNGGIGENLNRPSDNEIDSSSDTLDEDDEDDKSTGRSLKNLDHKSTRHLNWYEHRAIMRKEARKRMEEELFHDNPPTVNWYLKRMRKRDQCRAIDDNCSYRKSLAKKIKNYKTKT